MFLLYFIHSLFSNTNQQKTEQTSNLDEMHKLADLRN